MAIKCTTEGCSGFDSVPECNVLHLLCGYEKNRTAVIQTLQEDETNDGTPPEWCPRLK